MSGIAFSWIGLTLFLLAGCASKPNPAPVRESSHSIKGFPVVPQGHYRIQPGDTLYKIAFQHGFDYRDLARWNALEDPAFIRSGELLRLSPAKSIVRRAPTPIKPRQSTDKAEPGASLVLDTRPDGVPAVWAWPSHGPLLSGFGDMQNKGVDIGGQRGQPVQAAASGRVVYAGSNLRGYGKLIIIRHGEALLSAYAHNERLLVTEGQQVIRGQPIAQMGDSDADLVKLHFEIREYGKPVNPFNYLPKMS